MRNLSIVPSSVRDLVTRLRRPKFVSPLQRPPLRLPGQSLTERILHEVSIVLVAYFVAALLVLAAMLEWIHALAPRSPSPLATSALAIVAVLSAVFCSFRGDRRIEDARLGRQGEVQVGQFLEQFRSEHYIFHDVPTPKGNIDHVLVGPKGVFSIETKTMRKPMNGERKVRCHDGELFANGVKLKRNPLLQARAQASWLRLFYADADFKPPVKAVVLFPGWFVEQFDQRACGFWVLEPKALATFLDNESPCLTSTEVKALVLSLSAYIRANATV